MVDYRKYKMKRMRLYEPVGENPQYGYNGNGFAGTPFYESVYECPICKKIELVKTVCRPGNEPVFGVEPSGEVMAKRLFTCPICHALFAPTPGYAFGDMSVASIYVKQAATEQEYWSMIRDISRVCTTNGRPDL